MREHGAAKRKMPMMMMMLMIVGNNNNNNNDLEINRLHCIMYIILYIICIEKEIEMFFTLQLALYVGRIFVNNVH